MLCKNCEYYKQVNSNTVPAGLCTCSSSYFPVKPDESCWFVPKPYTCGDCDRLHKDYACFTCRENNSAYINNKLCSGFIDKQSANIEIALTDWYFRGFDVKKKLDSLYIEWSKNIKPNREEKNG